MGSPGGIFWLLTAILLINTEHVTAQARRNQSPRAGPRSLGSNPKASSSSSIEFDCPEEFGYFPHPNDCSQYYVCVFGGALLESCTGGLMYSHELQTCDWPRNVGCEVTEVNVPTATAREVAPRVPQVSSRIRFSSVIDTPSAPSAPAHIQQIQTLPPPDQYRVAPNPVITSRGQPKNFPQDEILKLYAEAHDTLPPAEEEESDRQQRVYRGQPSTIGQVQRDRDGILQQSSVNAIPNQAKIGSFAFGSQIPPYSDDALQDIDETNYPKKLDRKRRDTKSEIDITEKTKTEMKNYSKEESSDKNITKRSNDDEPVLSSLDEGSELLQESENNEDVQRRTRQLRPSIISSPWRVSSGASYRALNFAPSSQNSFGSSNNYNSFPSATAGLLFKNDGRFYPNNNFKESNEFNPMISSYSNKNKFNWDNKPSYGFSDDSREINQDYSSKYKQSSKISSHSSSSLLPLLFSYNPFDQRTKITTAQPAKESGLDNYSYFHLGNSQQLKPSQSHGQQNKVKTFAFPVTNLPATTPRSTFVNSFNSVGGFFNNNNHQSPSQSPDKFGFTSLKPLSKPNGTPAPIYEGPKSASSYDSRYTTPSTPKTHNTSPFANNPFLNNLSFKNPTAIFNFDLEDSKNDKVIEITTKKPNFQQYPIPSSTTAPKYINSYTTPKYVPSYTTPNQLFDFDRFVAGIREAQRLQNSPKFVAGVNNNGDSLVKNKTNTNSQSSQQHYQLYSSPSTPTVKGISKPQQNDEYYYDEEDENSHSIVQSLTKIKTQSAKPSINNYNSYSLNKKPALINSNSATDDDEDEYYYDEDDDDDYMYRPPPINKSIYTPMTETMAPRPMNITTVRPYYVSGQTFTTTSPLASTSSIPSILKFPDDVFQGLRPFTTPAPKFVYIKVTSPKSAVPATTTITTTTRSTTKKSKSKATTKKTVLYTTTSTTSKPSRTTTRRKIYTMRPNRGNLKFKATTKRPDLTVNRLEIDENLPNRVEQSSTAPINYNVQPQKTQNIQQQNKNYYNTSNYNPSQYDPYYSIYDDDVEIYRDVDYSNQYQQKPTQSSTYRPSTTQQAQTIPPKPQTQPPHRETYVTQTQKPQQTYHQTNIYSSADYDDALVAQLEEDSRYGQQSSLQNTDLRGDRNEINSLSDRAIIKLQSPIRSNSPKYSPLPAFVSTPEPFSYKPTTVTQRPRPTTLVTTAPIVTTTTTQRPTEPQYVTSRSSLSEGVRNQTANRFILTLSARGPQIKNEPIQKIIIPKSFPSHSQSISSSLSYTTSTNKVYTESVTFPTKTIKTSTTSKTTDIPKVYSLSKIQHAIVSPVDHYYYSDQRAQDYYDNVDEISIPSQIKSLNHKRNHSSSLQSSSTSFFLPTSPPKTYVRPTEPYVRNTQFKFSEYSHPQYDQSTLKSFFMKSNETIAEHLSLDTIKTEQNLEISPITTKVSVKKSARDFDPVKQQQKINSFVVSDNQPSSFKAPHVNLTTTIRTKSLDTNPNNNFNNYNAFVNTQRLSTTLTPSTTIPSTILSTSMTPNSQFISITNRNKNNSTPSFDLHSSNQSPKPSSLHLFHDQLAQNKIVRLTLSSEHSLPSKKQAELNRSPYSQGSDEEIKLFKTMQPENNDYRQIHSLYLKPIEPTTYAPVNPFKPSAPDSFKNPATFSFQNDIIDDSSESDSFTHSRRRPYLNNLPSEIINPTRFPPRTTTLSPSTSSSTTPIPTTTTNVFISNSPNNLYNFKAFNENIQSFTSRGIIFKEALNRTYEPLYLKPIVSPFISLENQRFTNAIRNTSPSPQNKNYSLKYYSTTTNVPNVPTRSYFLITAPAKETTPSPSTFLFPDSSTLTTSSVYTTTYQLPSTTSESTTQFYSTDSTTQTFSSDHSRGRYRPYLTYTTENNNNVEEPTTYSPRMRYNTRTQTLVDTVTAAPLSFETPQQRRKLIRTKTKTISSQKSFEQFIPSTEKMPKETAKFVASPLRETSQFKPIYSKNNFDGNKPFSGEKLNATSLTLTIFNEFKNINESVHHSNEPQDSIIQITDKPIYYTRYRFNNAINNGQVLEETSTKKFRATIEMPEMDVPTEKHNEQSYVEDENEKINNSSIYSLDLIENDYNREHEVDYAYVDSTNSTTSTSSTTSTTTTVNTTVPPKTEATTEKLPLTTYSTTSTQQPTTARTTTTITTYRTTEKPLSTAYPKSLILPRVSRVNNAIKTSIEATLPRRISNPSSAKCNDNSPNALQCNEIPSRQPSRVRGSSQYAGDSQTTIAQRGTHPPRTRPTLKPSQTIVSKAQEFVDIYRFPPTRPDTLYPQPTPDKTAAKCRKDVCLLPDCYCGGKDIPGKLTLEETPQLVLITFEDAVNDVHNKVFDILFDSKYKNPNECDIRGTFFVSHEWTDYSLVQNLYADGHEIGTHTISHSFGEQFSLKKWAREVAGQREILAAYGGVKLEDVRGMRAPFLSIGGNKMFKMLHDFNFTYDSSMPVYENRPPSWPYTLDYKIFHDCMIPPCPTKSYPGVWEVPMVMWQDLNGGRCSMGDACSNPADKDNVRKMIMKNFERHYTTNRAPFGLFYHAAWFTQPHHKAGFIEFLDEINAMKDVYIVTNWQALQWVRDPTPLSRMNSFQPFQCNYQDRPKRCNNPKVCNLWHKSGVRYMRTCQPCPEIYPWTGKSGIRSSRIDNDLEITESTN